MDPTAAATRPGPPRRRWRFLSDLTQDSLLAAALAGLGFVPTLADLGPEIGDLPARAVGAAGQAVGLLLPLALCAPLSLRRRRPGLCLGLVAAAFAATQVLGQPDTFATVAILLALYSAGAHLVRRRAVAAGTVAAAYVVLAIVLDRLGSPQRVPDFLAFFLFLAATWVAGAGVRRWRREDGERRRLAAEVATAAERSRIARELHDVVTHHVTAMVVQAEASHYHLSSEPGRAAEGLDVISGAGRRALTELRSLLDVLEDPSDGGPGDSPAVRVSDLVEQARRSGQPVEFVELGDTSPVSVDAELAAYRIVQETLTNAIRYAGGRATSVVMRRAGGRLELEVSTDSPDRPVADPLSGGRGLSGLQERARLLGGDLEAGSVRGGGFRVRAYLPSTGRP